MKNILREKKRGVTLYIFLLTRENSCTILLSDPLMNLLGILIKKCCRKNYTTQQACEYLYTINHYSLKYYNLQLYVRFYGKSISLLSSHCPLSLPPQPIRKIHSNLLCINCIQLYLAERYVFYINCIETIFVFCINCIDIINCIRDTTNKTCIHPLSCLSRFHLSLSSISRSRSPLCLALLILLTSPYLTRLFPSNMYSIDTKQFIFIFFFSKTRESTSNTKT